MTEEFKIAIEELYSTFDKYSLKPTMEGCPCCVSDNDKSTLHSKKLRELEDDDISKYAFKAMTTWGDIYDFKHYLPRIFELTATRKLVLDTFVILGKLDYGNWNEWEIDERNTIIKFLKAWWKYDINNAPYFDSKTLIEINNKIHDLKGMLHEWDLNINSQGFKNYVDFIENYYYDLKGKNKSLSGLNQDEIDTLILWIEVNSNKLEKGFFEYESEDEVFSKKISDTLYMLERL
ncbi:hypothetical protein [Flammeovirga sp. SJP92]|uniref:hypothetical protein n=1 Tax=Flammeovirga sp. SJP92 TaxID=1775430 RepID=UPI000788AB52|nr:hypothetical protein [Flammeovirga sp. SJP92]KXX69362.1 hypothetical protein AVL50_19405 [Flammeovirga sp. SJP92]